MCESKVLLLNVEWLFNSGVNKKEKNPHNIVIVIIHLLSLRVVPYGIQVNQLLFLALIHLRIGEGETLKDFWLNGLNDGGVHGRETTGLLGELGVKVAHGFLPTLK